MTNPKLARDYLQRARARLKAVALLLNEGAFADVVRESQEAVELLLKAVLRSFGIGVPFSHDLSASLTEHAGRFPVEVQPVIPRWSEISRQLRKDRELSFYGSEDVTPSEFCTCEDAERALAMAEEALAGAAPWIK